jgi:hypothetical protein
MHSTNPPEQSDLSPNPRLNTGDVMAVTGKVSGGIPGRTEATVKSVLIGAVPDRGGRTTEGRSAAAAMPSWAPRSTGIPPLFARPVPPPPLPHSHFGRLGLL